MPPERVHESPSRPSTVWIVVTAVGVMLVAANLRPAVVSVAPLVSDIRHSTGFSSGTAGLLTTLPILFFGLVAPFAPWLAARFGFERAVFGSMVVLIAGIMLRAIPGTPWLFAGSAVVGAAIGVCNVILPGLIKRDFSHSAGMMTGLYSMTMTGGAAVAAAFTVPIDDRFGGDWRKALASWVILAMVAVVVWIPQLRQTHSGSYIRPAPLWGNKIAWAITIFMGSQSFVFYTFVAWIPTYLTDRGYDRTEAGTVLAAGQFAAIVGSLVIPIVAGRFADQRWAGIVTVGSSAAGLLGLLCTDVWAAFWCMLVLFGPGSALGLALLFMVRRSRSAEQTNQVSGMAQCLGYVLAAAGPFGLGVVHDVTGSWAAAFSVIAVALCTQTWGGWVAGRNVHMTAE